MSTSLPRNRVQESPEWISREDLERHAHPGILVLTWHRSRQFLQQRLIRPLRVLRIAFRSFRAHTSLLLAKKEWVSPLDNGLVQPELNGPLVRSNRAIARRHGIEQLFSLFPW